METGTYISGVGHLIILGWAALGGAFYSNQKPQDFTVADVSLISEAAFSALQSRTPEARDAIETPIMPEPETDKPNSPKAEVKPERLALIKPLTPQTETTAPDLAPLLERPEAEASIEAPELSSENQTEQQGATIVLPDARTSTEERAGQKTPDKLAVIAPLEMPSPRVDTNPAPLPPEEAKRDDTPTKETAESPEATEKADESEERAPDQASSEVVTEANKADSLVAPTRTSRPKGRPAKLAEQNARDADAIAEAVARAAAEAAAAATQSNRAPVGPPLNETEKDGLRLAVQKCWNVGSLSSDALRIKVVVGVALEKNGQPLGNTIRLIRSTPGSDDATKKAYETARRAILRCGPYTLPSEKYDHWQNVEITFNPENMRQR